MKKKKKPISVASRKAKGRSLQNWLAERIGKLLNLPSGKDTEIAPRPMGQSGVDIILQGAAKERFRYSCECKCQESLNIWAAIDQAKNNLLKGTDWLLIIKKNRYDVVAVLDAEVFFKLLERLEI